VAADFPSIALRVAGQDHALEPGRNYLLGSAADCDLRLLAPAVAPHHASLRIGTHEAELVDLGSPGGSFCNGERIGQTPVTVGDLLRFGEAQATVVDDLGTALIVPLPDLRLAARDRRFAAVRAVAGHRTIAPTFEDMVAGELRRAPWLAVSLVLHALLLLLLWMWLPNPPPIGNTRKTVTIDFQGGNTAVVDDRPPLPEVLAEPEPPATTEPPPLPMELSRETATAEAASPSTSPLERLNGNPRLAARSSPTVSSRGPSHSTGDVPRLGSGSFQKAVGELRRTGLEIVFVFDSTGSMSRTILDTKNTITQMLSVLRALVPDARIGLVTYRDRGPREAYLVRQMPLGPDFWRAANFVQSVHAGGGGDRPEDVFAGLHEAFTQSWQPTARRVVILAGDAPPHEADHKQLLREVREFARNGRSFVHTLVTSPTSAGADTRQGFVEIAEAGKGTCLDLQNHDRVMQRVLTLAFGREFDSDLGAVIRAIEAATDRTETWALDLTRRGGPELAAELRKAPVDYALMVALLRRPRQQVVLQLVDQLGKSDTPSHTRQAIAWVLQRVLELPEPPADPTTDEPPTARDLERLRRLASKLPE